MNAVEESEVLNKGSERNASVEDRLSSFHQTAWPTSGEERIAQGMVVQGLVDTVAVSALSVADSPRVLGQDPVHVKMLAVAHNELPPIIVHYPTMRVIDGIHRLRVAEIRGHETIPVQFFHGTEADAFVLAVKSNIAHGLPLSLTDRRAAALRIISSHRSWSDRMIASVTGISARTVAEIRDQGVGNSFQEDSRIGRDGRVRPINSAQKRLLACKLITDNPGWSLRQVARVAGISPETARDVKRRLRLGEGPVPEKFEKSAGTATELEDRRSELRAKLKYSQTSSVNPSVALERLKADPSLRLTETGRILLRLLHAHFVGTIEWEGIGKNVPPHCSSTVAGLARRCAEMWQEMADQLEQKTADIALTFGLSLSADGAPRPADRPALSYVQAPRLRSRTLPPSLAISLIGRLATITEPRNTPSPSSSATGIANCLNKLAG
jgi:hypothetical protein